MIHLKGVAKSSLVQILMQVLVPDSVSAQIWNELFDFADMSTADVGSIGPSIVSFDDFDLHCRLCQVLQASVRWRMVLMVS